MTPVERRVTEIGVERRCNLCLEWWPEDLEFFERQKARASDSWRLRLSCRACRVEKEKLRPKRSHVRQVQPIAGLVSSGSEPA